VRDKSAKSITQLSEKLRLYKDSLREGNLVKKPIRNHNKEASVIFKPRGKKYERRFNRSQGSINRD
jgi:hypothetical protein